jgi:hypothetical protein
VGGAAGWAALLALSLTKARFNGRDSMKSDREEVIICSVKTLRKIIYERFERHTSFLDGIWSWCASFS